MFRGGRKLRGGREKPQCGPGPARTSQHPPVRYFLDLSTEGAEARREHTSSVVASVLEASPGTASVAGSRSSSKLVLASAASSALAAAPLGHRASLVGFLLSRQSGLAFLPVLLQQLGGLLLLQLCKDDLAEAVALLRKSVEAWNKNRCTTVKNTSTSQLQRLGMRLTFHLEDGVLGHFLAIGLHLLLDPLLVVLLRRTDHHSFALEASEQAHLPLLARSRHISLEPRPITHHLRRNIYSHLYNPVHLHDPGCSSSSFEQRSQ